jgi:hypothetical protein
MKFEYKEAQAIFQLAGIPTTTYWELTNKYWNRNDETGPWWLFKTPVGLIRIGWRKKVIEIDWSDTPLRKIITDDDVTKDTTSVHAWSHLKAVEYLQTLWKPTLYPASE